MLREYIDRYADFLSHSNHERSDHSHGAVGNRLDQGLKIDKSANLS